MGLAPYGEPQYVDLIYEELIDLREDGSFRLDEEYFNYLRRPHDDQSPLSTTCSADRRERRSRD